MRFIVMHKTDAKMESGAPPSMEIIEEMGKLVGGSLREGVFKDGAGLHRSAKRVRLRYRGGARDVMRGPYAGEDETVAGLAMVKAKSIEDAMNIADRFAKVLGDGEIEIGPVVEPWDLGVVPEPEGPREHRFLLLGKGEARPNDALLALEKSLADEGVLISAAALTPMSRASRLPAGPRGKRTWLDGPFAESKELIAGYSILELPSKADALAWAARYADILEGNEVDVRELL